MKNIFTKEVSSEIIERINLLSPQTQAKWGKMNVSQMLAHCNVTYELAYENKHPKPTFFVRLILKLFVKKYVVNEVPYKKNGGTAPVFIITDTKNFELEKERLIKYIVKTTELGESYFENKESISFGILTSKQWNNMFYKHLDHHLSQFGV